MTYINWDKPFYIDLTTGETTSASNPRAIAVWTYGNYWGGGYSAGTFVDLAPVSSPGVPLTFNQLLLTAAPAKDALDFLAYRHDVFWQTQTSYTFAGANADLAYLNAVVLMDASYDPGASLTAGLTTLGMIGSITLHGYGSLLFSQPLKLVAALRDAFYDIRFGLENLPPEEDGELDVFIANFNAPSASTELVFDFAITTSTFGQELAERAIMSTLNRLVDGGESDNVPLNTGFFPGTTHYEISYNPATGDLDLQTA
jgi:hypothetical protein